MASLGMLGRGLLAVRRTRPSSVVHEETIEDIAARAAQILSFKMQRETHLSSDAGVAAQKAACEIVREGLLEGIEKLQLALPGIHLTSKQAYAEGGAILFLSDPVAMSVNWRLRYANTLTDAALEASLWRGHPPWPGTMPFEEPQKLGTLKFSPDLRSDGQAGWKRAQSCDGPVSSKTATEDILKFFLKKVQTH